ncbi:MAG: hypothetical protein AAB325_14130 [Pseudomonadota bacterium]
MLGAAALLAVSLPALGAAQGQQVNVFTFEDASCDAWTKSGSNKLLRAQYEFWVRGFASGHNYANPSRQVKIGAFPGSDALYQYLDQYCRDNPSLSFIGGAIRLVDELREPAAPSKLAPKKAAPAKKEPAKDAPVPAPK